MRPLKPPSAHRSLVRGLARTRNLERRFTSGAGSSAVAGLWGALYNDANVIDPGSGGWTAEWNDEDSSSPSSNIYTIRFDTPFSSLPTVLLTANNNNPVGSVGLYGVSLKDRDSGGAWITVYTFDFDGTASDGGFDFLAIAPVV